MQEQTSRTIGTHEAKLAYNSRFSRMDTDTKLPNDALIKAELNKYGINSADLTMLTYLTAAMTDRACFIDNIAPTEDVSSTFLQLHNRPKKLQKIMKRLGIYTMVSFENKKESDEEEDGTVPVTESTLIFIGKTPDNKVMTTEFKSYKLPSHKKVPSELWCGLAILRFCEQIQSYQFLEMREALIEENTFDTDNLESMIKSTGTTFKLSDEELEILKQRLPQFLEESETEQDEVSDIIEAEFTEVA